MKKNVEKALSNFIDEPLVEVVEKEEEEETKDDQTKKVILDEREGLIERVDKILVTKDGKQLLREQY